MTKINSINTTNLFLFIFLIFLPGAAIADARNTETPLKLEGGKIITASETNSLIKNKKVFLADCRGAFKYGKGHIPTATHVSYQHNYKKSDSGNKSSLKNMDSSKLPKAKDTTIIFYSHGITGWKSYKAAVAAINAGYSNVLWFRGGLEEWIESGYTVEH